ncbi:hypothetical protein UR09_00165 [Candidatus Nitromaritima sp. SCGC AAA799-A02]|nr:hypothetical protein UZ36_00160 [Candidatus Nitromaritima sp. SCGC AAA799-C22]KMP12737.1 hypothetical protein UR09_00165 [Candidatus Nitromaritima sp. SCGC AAA799-A02]
MFVTQQIWGIVMFFAGGWLLGHCSKLEREDAERMKDPKMRYGRRQSDIVRPKTIRGTVMTFLGGFLALGGMILFLMYSQLTDIT